MKKLLLVVLMFCCTGAFAQQNQAARVKALSHVPANLLKIKVFQKFYEFFENKKLFLLLKQIKRKNFNKKWSMQRFFKIIKYNTMFYLDIYSMSILFSGWIYEVLFFFKFMNFVKINNRILASLDSFNNYKYLISFKDFYFQLMIENIDYFLKMDGWKF